MTNRHLLGENKEAGFLGKKGREGEEYMGETGQREWSWKEDVAEAHGLEKRQVARDFISGEESGIEAYLPNIGMQFINIQLSCVFLAWTYWGWRFTATGRYSAQYQKKKVNTNVAIYPWICNGDLPTWAGAIMVLKLWKKPITFWLDLNPTPCDETHIWPCFGDQEPYTR